MTELNAFEERLLGDLLTAHREATARVRRRGTLRRAAGVIAAAAALLVAPVVLDVVSSGYEPSTGVLTIAEAEGGVVVSVEDASDEEAMNRQLADAGIPATVNTVPVSPYLVGRFVAVEAHGPRGEQVAMQAGRADEVFVPDGVEPGLVLHVGREPGPGEPPNAVATPFHPGEIFGCDETMLAADPGEVERRLRAAGVTRVEWAYVDADGETSEFGPDRPERGHLMSTNAVPGHDSAQVTVAARAEDVTGMLPPECPAG